MGSALALLVSHSVLRWELVMPHVYGLDSTALGILDTVAGLARDHVAPHAADVDKRARFPEEAMKALAKNGFYGLCLPKDAGGMGQGLRAYAAVTEELAGHCASTAMVYVMHMTATATIASSAVLENKKALLAEIAAGKHLTTLAFSERGSRSNFWAPVSKLGEQDGEFFIDAEKSWVTSAGHADSYVANAQMPGAESPLQSTVYLLRTKSRGVTSPTAWDGLGLRGNDSKPVALKHAVVHKADLISAQGEGANVKLGVVMPWFAVGTAAMAHGLCRAAVAATTAHLTKTWLEHTGQTLRDLPNLRTRLARMNIRTEQSRSLLAHTITEMENPSEVTPLWVLQARHSALEAAVDVTGLAMKACGGAAFSKHLPVERLFRDAQAGWVMAPTVDHLDDFIGRALVGLPLFG
jgi:alkylation response protein AidB-like acyl-CoA dehydrogenase